VEGKSRQMGLEMRLQRDLRSVARRDSGEMRAVSEGRENGRGGTYEGGGCGTESGRRGAVAGRGGTLFTQHRQYSRRRETRVDERMWEMEMRER
jgi:hypothetical protein